MSSYWDGWIEGEMLVGSEEKVGAVLRLMESLGTSILCQLMWSV